jgi:thiamine biosynthesis lipoprotein
MMPKKVIRRATFCAAILYYTLLAVLVTLLAACSGNGTSGAKTAAARSEFVLGTFCRIDLFEDGSAALYDRLFVRLAELEHILSANRDDSELANVNRNAGVRPVPVSDELFTVLERSLYFAKASGGAFDPTVGPLVRLWAIGTEKPRLPLDKEIAAALDLVNWRDLELGEVPPAGAAAARPAKTAFLKRQGMALDLGAIAKGYAADELARILREAGVQRALIDLGGNVYVFGKKGCGEHWRIGVQDPHGARGQYAGVLAIEGDRSVVSSGTYERAFTGADGKRYHHILELSEHAQGKRGYPVENGVVSVTVISASSMDADALSTSCFALGLEKGQALAAANEAEVLYIEENNLTGSPGAMALFTLSD